MGESADDRRFTERFVVPGQLLFENDPSGLGFHRLIFDQTGVPVDYTFDAVNPAFEVITGLKASQVIGKTAQAVFAVMDQRFLDRVSRVALTGERTTFDFWSVPLEKWLRLTAFCHQPQGFATIFQPRFEPETGGGDDPKEDLRYRTFFELPNAVKLIIDAQSHFILEANPQAEQFYGWSKAELRQTRIDDINTLPQEKLAALVQGIYEGKQSHFPARHRLKSGEVREVEVYTSPGPWAGGWANYAIIHDVTEMKRLERQSLQAERLKAVGELTTSLSHEFGNLLSILFSQIELLGLEVPEGTSKNKIKDRVQTQFVRARKLVESVKRFSKDQPVEVQEVRLSPFLEDLVEIENPSCKRAGIGLEFRPATEDWVQIDVVLVQQVFLNLFKNAVEALVGTPGAHLGIEVATEESEVVVRISNNGPPIPPEVRQKLFTPFFTTKSGLGEGGTGLGLSFSSTIIRNHGGTLTLENTAETTFQVRLPRVVPRLR